MKLRPEFAYLNAEELGSGASGSGPPVVICCDERYSFPARVALTSLLLNSATREFELVVVGEALGPHAISSLHLLGKRFGTKLTLVHVDQSILPEAFTSQYMARSAFYRLILPDILDADRILYLDADIIVQADVSGIWEEAQPDRLVGGVPDPGAQHWRKRFGAPDVDLYLNSGVLLIDAAAWRQENATGLCRDWLRDNQRLAVLADQDAISCALAERTYAIAQHWNVNRNDLRFQGVNDLYQLYSPDDFRGIFHFNGPLPKPWCRWADPWSQDLYLRYARIVGLPPDYWVEARKARDAIAEARWAERQGNHAKANDIYRKVLDAAFVRLRELKADGDLEIRQAESAAGEGAPTP